MIDLTRLNGHRLMLNCDLIRYAEATPDTTLTLVTGEKLIVQESLDEVADLVRIFRATILGAAFPDAGQALSAKAATVSCAAHA